MPWIRRGWSGPSLAHETSGQEEYQQSSRCRIPEIEKTRGERRCENDDPHRESGRCRRNKEVALGVCGEQALAKKRKAELVETIKDYREEANLLKHGRTLVDPGNRKHYVVVPKEAFSEWIDNVLSTPDAVKTAMQRALDDKTGHPRKDTGS